MHHGNSLDIVDACSNVTRLGGAGGGAVLIETLHFSLSAVLFFFVAGTLLCACSCALGVSVKHRCGERGVTISMITSGHGRDPLGRWEKVIVSTLFTTNW